jgi:hypothetical protein
MPGGMTVGDRRGWFAAIASGGGSGVQVWATVRRAARPPNGPDHQTSYDAAIAAAQLLGLYRRC